MSKIPEPPDDKILDHAQAVSEEIMRRCSQDLLLFVRNLVIPSAHGALLFDQCIEPFQVECFQRLEGPLKALLRGEMPNPRRFWIERTKKAGKDSDLAACLLWMIAFSTRPLLVQVCAANQKQAGIIKRRAADLLHYNPWLESLVTIQMNRIVSQDKKSEVVIEATDATGGAHGETPDLLILNELVHVARWSAMETHMNNADGVPRGVVVVSTNAGIKGTKAHQWRTNALCSTRWVPLVWHEVSPWVNPEDVEDARARDPVGSEFARLWQGRWVSGSSGAVDEVSIDRCFSLDGPARGPLPGWQYVAGLDLGVSHDHAGVAVLGTNANEGLIHCVWAQGWSPSVRNDRGILEVDLMDVEQQCVHLCTRFRVRWWGYDPAAGGSFMAQRLRHRAVPMREWSFGNPTNLTSMATAFVTALKGAKLKCYEDQEGRLRKDFGKFTIEPRVPSGYVLRALSDESGHADVGTALVICLPEAMSLLRNDRMFLPTDIVADDPEPLDDDSIAGLPPGLAELLDLEDRCSQGEPIRWGRTERG